MEDWKAEQNKLEEEVIYTVHPSTTEVKGPVDQFEQNEQVSEKPAPKTSIPRRSEERRRSTMEDEINEWEEQDSAFRNSNELNHTLMEKECAAEDVIRVWEEISKYIIFKMMEGQAVRIAGLGTFSCKVHKVPVNQKSVKITKMPVFMLSENLANMYRLTQDKPLVSNAPTTALNLSVIANESQLPRGMVEGILTEILQAFARGIVCNKSLEFPFPFIGKLYVRDQKVVMKFYNEFCKKLGFHMSQTPSQDSISLVENMIHGHMTPLRMHIPSQIPIAYRSVFHLREIRSVHEDSLLVPVVKVDGKYVLKSQHCSRSKRNKSIKDSDSGNQCEDTVPCKKLEQNAPCGNRNPNADKMTDDTSLQLLKTQPIYQPQMTGDCVLDLMTACPIVMNEVLKATMYKVFVDTLGADVVKSHFHRRGNQGPQRKFSYSDIDVEPEYPEVNRQTHAK